MIRRAEGTSRESRVAGVAITVASTYTVAGSLPNRCYRPRTAVLCPGGGGRLGYRLVVGSERIEEEVLIGAVLVAWE